MSTPPPPRAHSRDQCALLASQAHTRDSVHRRQTSTARRTLEGAEEVVCVGRSIRMFCLVLSCPGVLRGGISVLRGGISVLRGCISEHSWGGGVELDIAILYCYCY